MKGPLVFNAVQRDLERFRTPGQGTRPTSCSPVALTGRCIERSKRRGFLGVALFLTVLWIALAAMMGAQPSMSERKVPPPGIRIPDETWKELEAGAKSLAREIESLRVALKAKPDKLELLPDVQILHKAVDWALRYDEIHRSNEVQIARALLSEGKERAAQLRKGEAPWTSMTGLVVRGYVSRLDGSVQPYGLVVPASFARNPVQGSKTDRPGEHRLDIWLHGRDDHLSEQRMNQGRAGVPH